MEKINDILQNFSFSQPESELYLATLKLKKATVAQIAQKAGMGRTVAYFHIKNMLKRNLLKQYKKGGKTLIAPISPSDLAERLQERVGSFKTFVPRLESLNTAETQIPEIEILESNEAFQKIYDEITHMPAGSIWKIIEDKRGANLELKQIHTRYWNEFFTKMAERDIVTKAIFTKELLSDLNKSMSPKSYALFQKRKWNIHTISEEKLPIKNLVALYNNKISFMFPEISMTITIMHPALFYVVDTMFETIFNFSESVQNPWNYQG